MRQRLSCHFRFCADEFTKGGTTLDYAKVIAKRLVDGAGVDAFDVTDGNADTGDMIVPPRFYSQEEGWFSNQQKLLKRQFSKVWLMLYLLDVN